jgi:hypothetical protein
LAVFLSSTTSTFNLVDVAKLFDYSSCKIIPGIIQNWGWISTGSWCSLSGYPDTPSTHSQNTSPKTLLQWWT